MVKVAVLVLLVALAGAGSKFGIQIHSWNDRREWPAMIRKGIDSFKIDLHYVSDSKLCEPKNLSSPCLLLHHDLPPSSAQFYTAYDALDYFAAHHTSISLRIALCTKYQGDKCDATYLNTMQTLFDKINEYRANNALLNVEFVLDQALEPTEACLQDRFLPWVSTMVPSRDPQEAITSNEGINKRFQIYNPSVGTWDTNQYLKMLASWDPPFGKFKDNGYPIQIWEPLDQYIISELATYYSSLQIDKELDFATNEDPLQKRLYLAPYEEGSAYQYIQLFKTEAEEFYIHRSREMKEREQLHILVGSKKEEGKIESKQISSEHRYNEGVRVSFFLEHERELVRRINKEVEWEWKQDQNLLCFRSAQCVTLPALPHQAEKLVALDVSREEVVVGVTDEKNVYLGMAQTMQKWKLADKGTSVSISSSQGNTVLVVGDSYCWNSQEYNCHLEHPVCSSTPHSIKSVMSYSYGPTSAFLSFIDASEEQYISACNSEIMHGALGTGYNPKVAVQGETATVIFKGVCQFCKLLEAKVCGCSLAYPGLVSASFPLEYRSLN